MAHIQQKNLLSYGMARTAIGCLAAVLLTLNLIAGNIVPAKIGDKIADFSLKDTKGETHSLLQSKGSKATAVIFISTQCPYSNAFNHVMAELHQEYQAKGIQFVGINANKTEPAKEVGEHTSKNGLKFLVLKDEGNVVADKLGAQVTPEVFLLDKDMRLQYHGAIGNSKNPTTKPEEAKADEVRAALDAVLTGRPVVTSTTKAFGCTIKRQ
jgi:peroxiredoxin